jgi:thioredoxin reductase (NADPH)
METDVLIVGAGPIGLEVAAALQRDGLRADVVDTGAVGQTILSLFPTATRFYSSPERLEVGQMAMSLPNQEKPTGDDYLAYLRSVIQTMGLHVHTFERVTACTKTDNGFLVQTQTPSGIQRSWQATAIVLATGGTHHSRTLGVDGEDLPHVHRLLGNPHRFFERRVLVVGGRNSAAESALRIWRVGGRPVLSYRGEQLNERVKYWLRPEVQALMDEGLIQDCMHTVVERITPADVQLRHLGTGTITTIPVDDVLLQLGFQQDSCILSLFGVDVDPNTQAPTFDASTMQSNVPGVYIAGTATAGTQKRFRVYIETSHVHAARIAAAIAGRTCPDTPEPRILPES